MAHLAATDIFSDIRLTVDIDRTANVVAEHDIKCIIQVTVHPRFGKASGICVVEQRRSERDIL